MSEPPRHRGEVIGYRRWILKGHSLVSAGGAFEHVWQPGPNRAVCRYGEFQARGFLGMPRTEPLPNPRHAAPDPRCMCGFYGQHDPGALELLLAEGVIGVIRAWGKLDVHPNGFRAEYAEPVVLAYSEDQPYRTVRTIQAVGSELELAVVTIPELEEAAGKHGRPVPTELRPPRSSWYVGGSGYARAHSAQMAALRAQSMSASQAMQRAALAHVSAATKPPEPRAPTPVWLVTLPLLGALFNLALFGLFGDWINGVVAAVAGAVAACMWLGRRRAKRR